MRSDTKSDIRQLPAAATWSAAPIPVWHGIRGTVMGKLLDAIYEQMCAECEDSRVSVPRRDDALLSDLAWRVRVLCDTTGRPLLPLGADILFQALFWRSDWNSEQMGEGSK